MFRRFRLLSTPFRSAPVPPDQKRAQIVTLGDEEPMFGIPENQKTSFLPYVVKQGILRFVWRLLALCLGFIALCLALAFVSYNALDPSLNTATTQKPSNFLGSFGALAADLALQSLGFGAWHFVLLIGCSSLSIWQTLSFERPVQRMGWAGLAIMLGCLCLSLAFVFVPTTGGVLGFILLSFIPGLILKLLAFPLSLIGALVATCLALRLRLTHLRVAWHTFASVYARFVRSSQNSDSQAGLMRRKPNLWIPILNLFRRPARNQQDMVLASTIPTFLQQGAAAETPRSLARREMPLNEGTDRAANSYDVASAHFSPSDRAPSENTSHDSGDAQNRAMDPHVDIGPDSRPQKSGQPEFIPLWEDDKDMELTRQRPSTKLVETAQLARQKSVDGHSQTTHTSKTAAPPTATYDPPALDLLYRPKPADRAVAMTQAEADIIARRLEETLRDYGVKGDIVRVLPGPVVTLYELEPAPGTKTSRVVGLADDIARSMSALSARIASVPGKSVIGIELPNPKRETVFLHEMLRDPRFAATHAVLPLALGKDIGGQAIMGDLAKMPHLLVAGTTGSGKSVAVNTMILSLVYALSPEQVRFIMIDPKILELSVYDGIPHLLSPVVTDPKKAVVALKWVVQEMNQRYHLMSALNVRNIANFNTKIKKALQSGEILTRQVQAGFDPDTGEPIIEEQTFDTQPLPHIVVIVDEMAELMLMVGKDVEAAIQSIAQKARAAGIHMIMATQRPSVDVITGTIKANFPTRISFAVSSKIDSRTVLNEMGAEQLLGQGDMLYQPNGSRTIRVHGPFVSDDEVEAVVAHLRETGTPTYVEAIENEEALEASAGRDGLDLPLFEKESSGDGLYDKAVQIVLKDRKASTSHVQRRLQIGYNRAANLIDRMEQEGLISSADHVGRRTLMIPADRVADEHA